MNVAKVHELADEEGYKKNTLYESRTALGITTKRIGIDPYWVLPAQDDSPLDNSGNTSNNGNSGNSENPGNSGNLRLARDNPPRDNSGNVKNYKNPENFRNSGIAPQPPLTPFESNPYSRRAEDSGNCVNSGVFGVSPDLDGYEAPGRDDEHEELF